VCCRKLDELTRVCDEKFEGFKQMEQQDTQTREDLKHTHTQAKKLEKSLATEQKKVPLLLLLLLMLLLLLLLQLLLQLVVNT